MKKIPTLFAKNPENPRLVVSSEPVVDIFNGCMKMDERVKVFLKLDGQSCAVIDGKLYTRYDAKLIKRKRGKVIKRSVEEVPKSLPKGAIACQEPDPKSGHWPHWVPCDPKDKTHGYIFEGYERAKEIFGELGDGTYEIIGPKFAGNKHGLKHHLLFPHRHESIEVTREFKERIEKALDRGEPLFEAVKGFVVGIPYEGIVIWKMDEPIAKIRRSDFDMDIDVYESPYFFL